MTGSVPPEESVLFQGVTADGREALLKRAVSRRLDRKQVLFHEGEKAAVMFLLEAGRLKLTQLAADGQEVLVRFVGPGEICAGVAVLEGSTYPVTAQAVEPVRLLQWPREAVRELAERHPRIQTNILRAITGHLHDSMTRARELATERVPQRVARALLRLARQAGRPLDGGVIVDHPLSRQELAEMTGTTIYTVSRLLSQWEEEGVVEAGREKVTIRSLEKLEELAEGDEG
ncbi:MAG TPA: Crp/Fnr family transcriptional regulator [Thermoanaerobaculia bacterium]